MKIPKLTDLFALLLFVIVIYLSVYTRLATLKSPTVLDYDPWWHYRHAKEILDNNLQIPKWDKLSFYPPGRPPEKSQGWEYTMIIFYKIGSFFSHITLMDAAKWAPVIMVALTCIPAFLLGSFLTNKWGGLATAIFATLTPTFMGVSMAGYCDTDAVVVFYTFLCVYSIFLALRKKSIKYYVFAIACNLIFLYNWAAGWMVIFMFIVFIPALFIFRLLEDVIRQKKLKIDITESVKEIKKLVIPILIIAVVTNLVMFLLGLSLIHQSILGGLAFTGFVGQPLLVNISVAELQVLNIFSKSGFNAVVERVGLAPVLFTFFGLPALVFYKIYKMERINFAEIFLFLWVLVTFYLITRGVRFSLLFSCAAAVAAGYVIGNLTTHLKKDIISISIFGFILLLTLVFVSDAIRYGYGLTGMEISKNWYDMMDWLKQNADKNALVATWWDPGHILTGYTGLKVHADGAHCQPGTCIPYNHNIRIQDMGRIMSTNDEKESVSILKKYTSLTAQQIQEVKQRYGDRVPQDAFEPVSEVYLIASSDLIAKYYWMSYFGTGTGRNYFQLSLTNVDQAQGVLNYQDTISLVRKNDQWIPVYQNKFVIREIVYFENGQELQMSFENATNPLDGLLWVDPSYKVCIFMPPEIKSSVFTRLFFFDGRGLDHFELVYSNPEIRLYKVLF